MFRAISTALFALFAVIGGFTDHTHAEFFVVGALAAGLSHGAVDHLLSGRRHLGESLRFYVAYVGLFALMCLLWLLTPMGGTWAFFLVSAYHFGQSDFLTENESPRGTPLLWWTRGLILIIAPLTAWPGQAAEFISLLAGDTGDLAAHLAAADIPRWSVALWLLAIHLGALGAAKIQGAGKRQYAIDACALTLLMTLTPPFIGFAIYFVFWHTAQHWKWASSRLEVRDVLQLIRLAAPMTLLAAGGMAALWFIFQPGAASLLRWSIIGISALAVPHMLVVEMTTRESDIELWETHFGLTSPKASQSKSKHSPAIANLDS